MWTCDSLLLTYGNGCPGPRPDGRAGLGPAQKQRDAGGARRAMTWRRRASAGGADRALVSVVHGVGRRRERTASTASATRLGPGAGRSMDALQVASTCWRKVGTAAVWISAWAGTLPVEASATTLGRAAQCPHSGSNRAMTATKAKRRSVTSRISRAYRSRAHRGAQPPGSRPSSDRPSEEKAAGRWHPGEVAGSPKTML